MFEFYYKVLHSFWLSEVPKVAPCVLNIRHLGTHIVLFHTYNKPKEMDSEFMLIINSLSSLFSGNVDILHQQMETSKSLSLSLTHTYTHMHAHTHTQTNI